MAIARMTEAEKAKTSGIIELYTCIQSEGSRAGRPTVAVRTTGCTHRCYFGEGGWCDSWYTSIHPEKARYSFNDIIAIYNANPEIKEMMLTGGSPTMWPKLVNELTHFANERQIIITIETEGSHFLETDYPLGLISFSPKFSISVPVLGATTPLGSVVDQKFIDTHNRLRLNKDSIKQSMNYHSDYHIKPVIDKDLKVWPEVKAWLEDLFPEGIPKHKIWLMPAGDDIPALLESYGPVMDLCRDEKYNFTPRPHIIGFGTRREV